MADESLAALAGRGDERAFELLYERHRDPLYRYCRAILRHPEDAEEAVQASMLKAYRALSAGPGARAVRPWLFAIAHNECISLIRARPSAEPLPDVPDPAVERLEDRVEVRERLRQLRRDLLALPAPQREALVLRELSGLSHREIGQVMAEPATAVKQLIYEARQALLEYGAGRDLACGEVRRRLVDADGRVMRARRMTSHLRACEGCRAFVAEEERRRRGLLILFPPMPALVAGRILEGVVGPSGGAGSARLPGSRRAQAQVAGGLAAGAVAASVAVALALSGGAGPGRPPSLVPAAAAATPPAGSSPVDASRARAAKRAATPATPAAPARVIAAPAAAGGPVGTGGAAAVTTGATTPPPPPAGLGAAGAGAGGGSGGSAPGPDAAPGGSADPAPPPAPVEPAAGSVTTVGDPEPPAAATAAAVAGPTAGSGPVTGAARPAEPPTSTAAAPTQTSPPTGGDASPPGGPDGTTTAPGRGDPPPDAQPVDQAPVDTVKTPPAETTPPDQGGTGTSTDGGSGTGPPPDRTVPAETVTRDRAAAIPG